MDPSLLFQGYTFGITNVTTNGFKLDTAKHNPIPLRIHSLSTANTNFTLGIVFHNSDTTKLGVDLNSIRIASMYRISGNRYRFGGASLRSSAIDVPSLLKNTTVVAWICKTGNTVTFDLSNYSAQYVGQTSSNSRANEIIVNLYTAYVKRVFYSSNYYSDDSRAHHEILIQEKLKGTTVL